MSYSNLHSHTYYSVLDGISKPIELARVAATMGMKSLAITDHGTLAGWPEFALACKDVGIKPIFGLEAYYVPDRRSRETFVSPTKKDVRTGYHLLLLAKNLVGCHNLILLNNIANMEGFYYRPKIDWEILMKHREGLIVGSACLASELNQCILGSTDALGVAKRFKEAFGADYYLEVMDNQMSSNDQRIANVKIFEIGKQLDIPVIPTNDSHYLLETEQPIHDLVLAIRMKKELSDPNRMKYDGLFHMKTVEEMRRLFPDHMKNTEALAEKVELCDIFSKEISVPINVSDPDNILIMLAEAGLKQLGLEDMDHFERLRLELEIILRLKMSAYFLATKEIVDMMKSIKCEIGWGRGSAGGSLVCYCLGITKIDPLKYGLLFERFMNEYRKDWPDIDLDVPQTKRKLVIKKIGEKFGVDNVAHISTVSYFNPKSLLRDICRAIGSKDADSLSKLVPLECKNVEDLQEKCTDLRERLEKSSEGKMIWDRLNKLLGIPRHVGIHASGIVISMEPITKQLPIRVEGEKLVVQFPMHFHKEKDRKESVSILELFGLLKFDILGLKTLDIVFSTAERVGINIHEIPLDDPKIFELIGSGQVAGVFQLDDHKRAIDICRRMKPVTIDEIAALLALNRPGLTDSGELEVYLFRRFQTPEESWFLHPSLRTILAANYGVCVYQEDMMRMAQAYAGYSLSEAEELRKGIGKKDKAIVERTKTLFAEKARGLGRNEEEIGRILKLIDAAGRYSFCKSHALGYAMITYACAYLSVYYPVEFFKSVISMAASDERSFYLSAAMIRGLTVLPPDVNLSTNEVSVENKCIRLGLLGIKRVGEVIAGKIVGGRPFKSMEQLATTVGKATASLLHIAGATSSIPDASTFKATPGALDEIALLGISLYSLKAKYQHLITQWNAKPVHEVSGEADLVIAQITDVKEHIISKGTSIGKTMAFIKVMDVHGPYAELLAFNDVYVKKLFKKGHFYKMILSRMSGGGFKVGLIEEIPAV